MPNNRRNFRSKRAGTATAEKGKMRASGKKISRRFSWRRTGLRALLIVSVVALPLLAAALGGPSIRGAGGWNGILPGIGSEDRGHGNGSIDADSQNAFGGYVNFGQISVRLFNPVTRSRLLAEFELDGISVQEDGPELEKIVKNKYRFVREQATIAVRNSTAAELADPKLILLKRRVLIRINRSLDRPLLKTVNLEHFSLSEATPELDLLGNEEETP